MRIRILVVLYGCTPSQSETLNSLYAGLGFLDNVELVVWNNGPSLLSENDCALVYERFPDSSVVQTINNISLAAIYNNFIDDCIADYYVILDHDSTLTESYLAELKSLTEPGVYVPVITMGGVPQSPRNQKKFSPGPFTDEDCPVAIGSGMVLSHEILIQTKKAFGSIFDERFVLYGVDTTFFYRIHKLGISSQIRVVSGFNHSLSRLEKEGETISKFRTKERAYDLGLTLRYYPAVGIYADFLKYILKFIVGRGFASFIFFALVALLCGRHYRGN